MKSIKEFAKTPELIEIVLDDEEIIKQYGEPVVFYMKDFVDINTYFDYFRSQTQKQGEELNVLLRKLILNKKGEQILDADEGLPIDIAVAALTRINETLGKSKTKPLTKEIGNQPA